MNTKVELVTTEQIAAEMLRCKLKAHSKINDLGVAHQDLESRLDRYEAKMIDLRNELKRHETQRTDSTNEIKKDIKSLKDWFGRHDDEEMEMYSKIVVAIEELTDKIDTVKVETDDNSKVLMQKRIEEEKQRAIDEAVKKVNDAHDAPYIEYKKKAILVIVTMITGALVTGLWEMISFISELQRQAGG